MKNIFLGFAIMTVLVPRIAYAGCISYSVSSCPGCTNAGLTHSTTWCSSVSTKYYGISESSVSGPLYAIQTCDSCKSGGKFSATESVQLSPSCTVQYRTCEENCTGCSNCTSDTSWSAGNTGYEKKVTRTCNCNTCNASTQYRCAAGYYGSSTNGTSGCTRCPSSGGTYGTSTASSTSITSCYIPSGVSISDSLGAFTFTSNCYYTN